MDRGSIYDAFQHPELVTVPGSLRDDIRQDVLRDVWSDRRVDGGVPRI